MSLSFSTVFGTQRRFGAAAHEAPVLGGGEPEPAPPGPAGAGAGLRPSPMRKRSLQLRQRARVPGSPLDALRASKREGAKGWGGGRTGEGVAG